MPIWHQPPPIQHTVHVDSKHRKIVSGWFFGILSEIEGLVESLLRHGRFSKLESAVQSLVDGGVQIPIIIKFITGKVKTWFT